MFEYLFFCDFILFQVALDMLPSVDPFKELKSFVPRLVPENVQIFDEYLGEGRFGPIFRGILHEENLTRVLAYKTMRGTSLWKDLIYRISFCGFILNSVSVPDDLSVKEHRGFISQLELYASFSSHKNVIAFFGVSYFAGKTLNYDIHQLISRSKVMEAFVPADQLFGGFEYAEFGTLKFYLRRVHKGKIKLGPPGSIQPSPADMRDHLVSLALDVASGMRHLASRGVSGIYSSFAL